MSTEPKDKPTNDWSDYEVLAACLLALGVDVDEWHESFADVFDVNDCRQALGQLKPNWRGVLWHKIQRQPLANAEISKDLNLNVSAGRISQLFRVAKERTKKELMKIESRKRYDKAVRANVSIQTIGDFFDINLTLVEALMRRRIITVGDLLLTPIDELSKIPNFGHNVKRQINSTLEDEGLGLTVAEW
jgi:hypothetical protein